MDRELGVPVVESDHHPDREHVVAHGVDEAAAELAVSRRRAKRPAHRVDHVPQRLRDLPDLLDTQLPHLRVVAGQPEAVERGAGEMPLRPLGEHSDPGDEVGARLVVSEALPLAPAALVAAADADDAAVGHEQLLGRGLRQDHRPSLLRALGEQAAELGEREDPVAVVAHRRRRGNPQRRATREQVNGLRVDRAVGRDVLDPDGRSQEPSQGARIDHGPGEKMRAGLLPLLEHGDRHVAESLGDVGVLLEQLPQPDRAGEPGRPGADDQDADLDALVRGIRRLGDELRRRERRREVARPAHA